ncbi:hypothetical protein FHR92_003692 [Fontibacillus solani]|uniref:Transposase n=1 Tax=Fontibacillus solani TaxID=1572857 RepID=A0A7W3SVV5_9BACL|nr:hypothetical protein [Fontibacillus solani]
MPFIEGEDRHQIHLLPYTLDEFVEEENPVRVIDAYLHSFLTEDNRLKKQEITKKLEVYQERMHVLQVMKQELKEMSENQFCVTDPDAKSMKNNGKHEKQRFENIFRSRKVTISHWIS